MTVQQPTTLSDLLQARLEEAKELLKIKTELGRLPDCALKRDSLNLIDDWFARGKALEYNTQAQNPARLAKGAEGKEAVSEDTLPLIELLNLVCSYLPREVEAQLRTRLSVYDNDEIPF